MARNTTKTITTASTATATSRGSKLTPAEYKARKAQAEAIIGYDNSSPIYGKQTPEVLNMIEVEIDNGEYGTAKALIRELQKRIAQKRLTYAK